MPTILHSRWSTQCFENTHGFSGSQTYLTFEDKGILYKNKYSKCSAQYFAHGTVTKRQRND